MNVSECARSAPALRLTLSLRCSSDSPSRVVTGVRQLPALLLTRETHLGVLVAARSPSVQPRTPAPFGDRRGVRDTAPAGSPAVLLTFRSWPVPKSAATPTNNQSAGTSRNL